MLCVPPPPSPFSVAAGSFLMSASLPPQSMSSSYLHNIFCLLCVVGHCHCSSSCCIPSPPQDPCQRRRSTPQPPPMSSYPLCSCSLVYLIVACICDGFDGRSFSSVNASQTFSRDIIVTIIIVVVSRVVLYSISLLVPTHQKWWEKNIARYKICLQMACSVK